MPTIDPRSSRSTEIGLCFAELIGCWAGEVACCSHAPLVSEAHLSLSWPVGFQRWRSDRRQEGSLTAWKKFLGVLQDPAQHLVSVVIGRVRRDIDSHYFHSLPFPSMKLIASETVGEPTRIQNT